MLAVFAVVEAAYHACGIHFDVSPLNLTWQYLDPHLLRHDLIHSVWYLHSQPPAFNLLLGLVLQVSGSHWSVALHACYVACGLGLYLGTFTLMRYVGVNPVLAAIAATAFLISPSFMLYEHWLFYPLPIATALMLSLVVLERFLEEPARPRAVLFSCLLLFLCASQTVYQLPYFMLGVGGVAAAYPAGRRALLVGAVGPFALLLAIYLKNFVVFGLLATGSWGGMSLAKMTVSYLPPPTLDALVTSGAVSRIALIEPFSRSGAYPDRYFATDGFGTVPALSAREKSTGGDNMNHIGYLRVSTTYLRDSFVVLRLYPRTFVAACADAWRIYFWSSAEVRFFDVNKTHIGGWNRVFDRVVYGRWRDTDIYVNLLIGLVLAVACPLVRLRWGQLSSLRESVLLASVVFNIVYLAIMGNTFEIGENNRFRFTTDALSLTMLLAGLQWTLARYGLEPAAVVAAFRSIPTRVRGGR